MCTLFKKNENRKKAAEERRKRGEPEPADPEEEIEEIFSWQTSPPSAITITMHEDDEDRVRHMLKTGRRKIYHLDVNPYKTQKAASERSRRSDDSPPPKDVTDLIKDDEQDVQATTSTPGATTTAAPPRVTIDPRIFTRNLFESYKMSEDTVKKLLIAVYCAIPIVVLILAYCTYRYCRYAREQQRRREEFELQQYG